MRLLVAPQAPAYHRDMERNEKDLPAGEDPRDAQKAVPDKQMYRWKDDGGALPPDPRPEPVQGQD